MPARIYLPVPSQVRIELQKTNIRGVPMGTSHHLGRRFADEQVQRARELRLSGMSYREIGEQVGAGLWTARNWCIGTRRARPHDRIIAKRRAIP